MIMRCRLYILTLITGIICAACIKEDRSGCPCYLHVDLSGVDGYYIHNLDLMMDQGSGHPVQWTAVDETLFGDTLIIPVNKAEFDFCAWGNLGSSVLDQSGRIISPGQIQDSLWSDSHHINTRCEDAYVSVVPERQYIPVTIIIRGMLSGISSLSPELDNVSDRLSFNGRATGSRVRYKAVLVEGPDSGHGYYLFKTMMLTQATATDATLNLDFTRDGRPLRNTFPLGQILSDIGEDISKTGRNPVVIDLTIGTASIYLTVQVNDWVTHGVFAINF